jgi:hypothetical protein
MTDSNESRGEQSRASVGCAALFGLPFAGFGIMMGGVAIQEFQKHGVASIEPWFVLVFHIVFTAIGIGLPILAWKGDKAAQERLDKLAANADQLWMTREDWATGRIDHDASTGAKGLLFFTIVWNAISMPAAYGAITREFMAKGNNEVLVVLLFPLLGVGLIAATVYQFMKARRFGKSRFLMEQLPGTIGTVMRGIVVTGVKHAQAADAPFTVALSCFRRHVTGSGKNRRTSMTNLWMEEKQFKGKRRRDQPDALAVPIAFGIPADARATTLENPTDRILWRLDVRVEIPGVDYTAEFEIPVFRTPESPAVNAGIIDDGPIHDAFVTKEENVSTDAFTEQLGVRIMPLAGGGHEFKFNPARHVGSIVALTLFNLLWAGAIAFMVNKGAPKLFPIVFGFFQFVLVLAQLHMMTSMATITTARRSLRCKRGPFGFGSRKSFDAGKIAAITISSGMQSGNAQYWDLRLETRAGARHTLVTSVKNRRFIDWLANTITTDLGLAKSTIKFGGSTTEPTES